MEIVAKAWGVSAGARARERKREPGKSSESENQIVGFFEVKIPHTNTDDNNLWKPKIKYTQFSVELVYFVRLPFDHIPLYEWMNTLTLVKTVSKRANVHIVCGFVRCCRANIRWNKKNFVF